MIGGSTALARVGTGARRLHRTQRPSTQQRRLSAGRTTLFP
jgi:hypothetical protein